MAEQIFTFAVSFGKAVLVTVLSWFEQCYEAIGMTELWIGAVTLAIVFSIFLVPLRGGGDLGKGSFGGFLKNKVNKAKGSKQSSKDGGS